MVLAQNSWYYNPHYTAQLFNRTIVPLVPTLVTRDVMLLDTLSQAVCRTACHPCCLSHASHPSHLLHHPSSVLSVAPCITRAMCCLCCVTRAICCPCRVSPAPCVAHAVCCLCCMLCHPHCVSCHLRCVTLLRALKARRWRRGFDH